MSSGDVVLGVSDFVALLNQTLEYAYGTVHIVGELANFKISKNRWVYFDLKDEFATVRFFGTVYMLPGPLENGMILEVKGNPRLHPQFGFSVTVQTIRPVGDGSIKKAADLLYQKLKLEGLFEDDRKRTLPYPPRTVGLITSKESAAYADFTKILNDRWRGIELQLVDVQVQGASAVSQIVGAIEQFNQSAIQPDVLVVIRGGGSADDLQAFNTEQVARAVAASRIPTLVAIGHEVDLSLAELVSDKRASTPSNAAELLVPERTVVRHQLMQKRTDLHEGLKLLINRGHDTDRQKLEYIQKLINDRINAGQDYSSRQRQLITALNPANILKHGYAIVRDSNKRLIRNHTSIHVDDRVSIEFFDAYTDAQIESIKPKG